MNQRRTIGLCLLLLAAVAAVLALLGTYNFAQGEGEGLDAAYTLSAVLAAGTCGGWAYHFMTSKPETQAAAAPPTPPSP